MNTKNKKIKIWGSLILCVLQLIILTSCSNSANPMTATFGEFKDISFYNAFLNYCEEMVKEVRDFEEVEANYKLKIEKGWRASEKLNEKTLNSDEQAITYSLELTIKDDYETEKNTVKFFMILDESDNTVRVRGAYLNEDDDWIEELSKDEAEEMISDIYFDY